jgi:hypothetical protein
MFNQQLDLDARRHDLAPASEQPRLFDFPTNMRGQLALETDDAPAPVLDVAAAILIDSAPHRLTTREKRERRAERLRGWADKREARADVAHQASHDATAGIPFGQPIIVGHHSEKRHRRAIERGQDAASAALEHSRTADRMAEKAANIEAATDRAIYDDDPDARERLTAKIERLEAQREQIKAENAAYRKAHGADLRALTPYQRDHAMPHRSYELTNLGGVIRNTRERLENLDRGPVDRIINARYDSACETCGAKLVKGTAIRYSRAQGARCVAC